MLRIVIPSLARQLKQFCCVPLRARLLRKYLRTVCTLRFYSPDAPVFVRRGKWRHIPVRYGALLVSASKIWLRRPIQVRAQNTYCPSPSFDRPVLAGDATNVRTSRSRHYSRNSAIILPRPGAHASRRQGRSPGRTDACVNAAITSFGVCSSEIAFVGVGRRSIKGCLTLASS